MEVRGHGFLPPNRDLTAYWYGSCPINFKIIRANSQWDDFIPTDELQKRNGVETNNCSSYGLLNCIETLQFAKYGEKRNYSERFLGIMSGNVGKGNDPHKVAEAIREYGLIDEDLLPFDDTITTKDQYYTPDPMHDAYKEIGKEWAGEYRFRHAWLPLHKGNDVIIQALKSSPIGMAVHSWIDEGGLYIRDGLEDNHFGMIYGFEFGEYWKFLDHYDNTKKKLAWEYGFEFGKVITLDKIHRGWFHFIKKLIQ